MRSVAKNAERWLLVEKYRGKPGPGFEKDRARLAKGEPVDYVIGWKPFLGCRIDLSKKPLIPRPETEEWVGMLANRLRAEKRPLRILDLCAGSGCIGIALARALPRAHITYAEKDHACLLQIRKNLRINTVPNHRTRVVHSDLLLNIRGKFDVIATNPPYIPRGRMLPRSVVGHEPRHALFGGKDGLTLIRRILKDAPAHLARRGLLVMECDSSQKRAIEALIKKSGYTAHEWRKDQYGRWRTVWLKEK